MAAIAVSQNVTATWLAGIAGVGTKARDIAFRAVGYAAATVLICAAGAAVAQLVAEILSFPAPLAITTIALMAAALLHSLRRRPCTRPGHRCAPAGTPRASHDRPGRI
jgi:hypothetical protein